MLTREDDIDVHALRRQGWTISAIARHLGRDRKTIRAYLNGRQAGIRAPAGPDLFDPFVDYCTARLTEDPQFLSDMLWSLVIAALIAPEVILTAQTLLRIRGAKARHADQSRRPNESRSLAEAQKVTFASVRQYVLHEDHRRNRR